MNEQIGISTRAYQQAQEDLNLARMLWRGEQQAQAIEIVQRLARSLSLPQAGLLLGLFALERHDLDGAREWCLWTENCPVLCDTELGAIADLKVQIYLAAGDVNWALEYATAQIMTPTPPSDQILMYLLRTTAQSFSPIFAAFVDTLRLYYREHVGMQHMIALMALQLSKFDYVLEATDILMVHVPDDPAFAVLHGYALIGLARIDDAIVFFERWLTRAPDHPRLVLGYSSALHSACRFEAARTALEKLVATQPAMAEAWVQLGLAEAALKQYDDARHHIEHGLLIDPNVPDGDANLASVLMHQNALAEAEEIMERMRAIPEKATPILIRNLGYIYQNSARQAQALAAYCQAIDLSPNDLSNWGGAVMAANYSDEVDETTVFDLHRDYGHLIERLNPVTSPPVRPVWSPLIRIGMVSGDFNNHACSRFSLALVEYLRQFNIHITLISSSIEHDHVTGVFRDIANDWIDARDMGNDVLFAEIRRRNIQALIDLSGHTAHNRLALFARRPCPMQVNWLGYPNTTGMTTIDYRVTDIWADPPGMTDNLHTEKLIRLDRCFLAYQPVHSDKLPPVVRGDGDYVKQRSGQPIVFGSLNNLAKITPACCQMWAEILHAVPDSKLLIRRDPMGDPLVRDHFTALFTAAGIDPDRLDLLAYDTVNLHYQTYQEIDIVLDCFPYNGTTTTCEAISAGVPVIGLAGRAHRSRVGVSLLNAIDRPEWVAENPADFVRICTEIAADPQALRQNRAQQAKDVLTTSLFDTYDFSVRFWEAMTSAWREICQHQ